MARLGLIMLLFGLAVGSVGCGGGHGATAGAATRRYERVGVASHFVPVPRNEWTNPHVRPPVGGSDSAFTLLFTARERLGHSGRTWLYYDVGVVPHPSQAKACRTAGDLSVGRGKPGELVRVPLRPPKRGWCVGQYRVYVAADGEPYCFWAHRQPCAVFSYPASPTGSTYFTVR